MTIEGFTRAQMAELPSRLLRDGRAANARVTCVTWQGREWTVKDFSPRNWWVRTFLAPFLFAISMALEETSSAHTCFAPAFAAFNAKEPVWVQQSSTVFPGASLAAAARLYF